MKKCLRCGQTYADDSLNYCLSDGEILVKESSHSPFDDTPPTIILDPTRVTNPIDWPSSTPAPWHGHPSPMPIGQQQYGVSPYGTPRDQTLPTVSLVLAVVSCFLVCCAGGIWLGLPAAIVGFIAIRNIDANPQKYSGRGMAIGGMVVGIVTFVASILFLIVGQLS